MGFLLRITALFTVFRLLQWFLFDRPIGLFSRAGDDRAFDLAVVGGGPAGLVAATTAAQAGAKVVLLEARDRTGGWMSQQVQLLQGPESIYDNVNGVEMVDGLTKAARSAGVTIWVNKPVEDIDPEPPQRVTAGDRTVTTRAMVLATGSTEPLVEFPGSHLMGVVSSTEAQAALNLRGQIPGDRVLVVGTDNGPLLTAEDLRRAGCEVVAIIDESPEVIGRRVNLEQVRQAGIPVMTSTRLVDAWGRGSVETASIAEIGPDGTTVDDSQWELAVDMICLAPPRVPETALSRAARMVHAEQPDLGGPVLVHDDQGVTATDGVFVCGDASGVESGAVAMETGRLAGLAAADYLRLPHLDADALTQLARDRIADLRGGPGGQRKGDAKAALADELRLLTGQAPPPEA